MIPIIVLHNIISLTAAMYLVKKEMSHTAFYFIKKSTAKTLNQSHVSVCGAHSDCMSLNTSATFPEGHCASGLFVTELNVGQMSGCLPGFLGLSAVSFV